MGLFGGNDERAEMAANLTDEQRQQLFEMDKAAFKIAQQAERDGEMETAQEFRRLIGD